ncbi:MAG: translational GTPase TypA [Alphaproteobacteria bacterium]|jgi:GTP-binding protein|nr:translational GTPase TypA [Alphaproteobacteria bacterium]
MNLRNIAIIAHVDHGKTTLVDSMLLQSGTVRANSRVVERAMDSGDLERERGITILSKCTSVERGDTRINIVDTPGHADFGGEVERILSMVDGVVVLVDAAEGPMPQTKFVVGKALGLGLRPIVVVNKIDRPDARATEVLNEVFDLFDAIGATDEQLDFPTLYASGRDGWASEDPDVHGDNLDPLFKVIIDHVPAPDADAAGSFRILTTMQESDPYLGRILTGRIHSGSVSEGDRLIALDLDGTQVEEARVMKLLIFNGLKRVPVKTASAGDIVAIAGFNKATVANTLASPGVTEVIAAQPIDPPTISVVVMINDSPLAGTEGAHVTSRVIRARLLREAEGNVALRVSDTGEKNSFEVAGRGELQLGVLFETMRREGFEFSVSRPVVIERNDPETGERQEPVEEVVVDVDDEFVGAVVEALGQRRAELTDMRPSGGGKTRVTFLAPARGLIGYHGEFLTTTRGTGVMYRVFHSYAAHRGAIAGRRTGVLIANSQGPAVAFALWNLEDRGSMFVSPGDRVYEGMVIGEHVRENDLIVNPLKAKQLTNIRASGKDDAVRLTTPKILGLEEAIAYIANDELVEVTPSSVRMRKRMLDPHDRKKAARAEAS